MSKNSDRVSTVEGPQQARQLTLFEMFKEDGGPVAMRIAIDLYDQLYEITDNSAAFHSTLDDLLHRWQFIQYESAVMEAYGEDK